VNVPPLPQHLFSEWTAILNGVDDPEATFRAINELTEDSPAQSLPESGSAR